MFTKRIQKQILILAIIASLSLVLAGCGSPGEEPTASSATLPPQATATTPVEPSPTEALPTETAPAATPTEESDPASLPEETFAVLDKTITTPEGAVIYFSQEGGFAGVMNHWFIYPDGTIVNSAGQTNQVAPEDVTVALDTVERSGFYDLNQPKPSDVCCDFFHYTLIARDGNQSNAVSLSEGEPDLPAAFSESVAAMLTLVENSFPSQ